MKYLYILAGVLVWAAGVLLFGLAMSTGTWGLDGLKLLTLAGFAIAAFFSIFSFLYGAQPGHYVRLIMIALFSCLCLLVYLNEHGIFKGLSYRLTFLAVSAIMVILSHYHKNKFEEEYRKKGRVNYFNKYFDN